MRNDNRKNHYTNYDLKSSVMTREQFQWVLLVFQWSNSLFRIVFIERGTQLSSRGVSYLSSQAWLSHQFAGREAKTDRQETCWPSDKYQQVQETKVGGNQRVWHLIHLVYKAEKCVPTAISHLTIPTTGEVSFPSRRKSGGKSDQNYCPNLEVDIEESAEARRLGNEVSHACHSGN